MSAPEDYLLIYAPEELRQIYMYNSELRTFYSTLENM
jgi:hypothetical protein